MSRKEQEIEARYADDDVNDFGPSDREEFERWLSTFDETPVEVIADQAIDFPESDAEMPF